MERYYVSSVVGKTVKIVHIIIGLNVGGAELSLRRLIDIHHKNNTIEHIVVSLTNSGPIGRQLITAGIAVYSLRMRNMIDAPFAFLKLRGLLSDLKPDIVQTWMYHADFLGGLAAKSVGVDNIVWNIRSTNIHKGGSSITLMIRKMCALMSYYIPIKIVCAATASRIEHEKVGYAKNKMIVIPNGFCKKELDRQYFCKIKFRSHLGITENQLIVLSVGRFNKVKDHKTFIRAADQVVKLIPNTKFLMVGRGVTRENKQLMKMIQETKRPNTFVLIGERDDITECMYASDVFCMHSKTEGFPNVLGEAMLCGLPCVSTNVGDAKHLLNNSAWIVPPSNATEQAEKLVQLLSLPAPERLLLGKVGSKRISTQFSMNTMSSDYLNLYEAIYKGNKV